MSLVVSEETGMISVASFGELEQGLTLEEIDLRINRHFGNEGRRQMVPVKRVEDLETARTGE